MFRVMKLSQDMEGRIRVRKKRKRRRLRKWVKITLTLLFLITAATIFSIYNHAKTTVTEEMNINLNSIDDKKQNQRLKIKK